MNQVRIFKRIILPCELVRFSSDKLTKKVRECKEKSCILWSFKFETMPKLLKKFFEMWNKFIEWLKA